MDGGSGVGRLQINLNPCAQEFFPTNPVASLSVQPQVFYFHYNACYRYPPPLYYGGAGFTRIAPPLLQSPCLPPPSPSPTRAILVSMVPPGVSESLVRRDLEVFGDVRTVQMERVREGIVTVHFYDLRHAQAALAEIQKQHMQQQYRLRRHYESVFAAAHPPLPLPAPGLIAGRAVWAQFTVPGVADGINQGTLVIFNLDAHVSASHIKDIFEAFGAVKELRETPMKRHQKFVEFYDVRDAARALSEMSHREINSKKILIQYSRPGCSARLPRYFPPSQQLPAVMAPPGCNNSKISMTHSKGSDGSIPYSMASSSASSYNGFKKCSDISCGGSSSSSSSSSWKQYGKANRRSWKGGLNNSGKQPNDHGDPRFLINEEAIAEADCRDSRTTVMIKNIPNKYSQKLLLNMLDNHCIHWNEQIVATHGGFDHPDHPKSSYDFVYLPIDFINKCNVGYGFVNMTSPQATWRLYKAFHLQSWEVFNSKKICEVSYARLQGLDALKEHFKNSKFPGEAEDYLPVVFSPSRDGKMLSDGIPIVGRPLISSKENECNGLDMDEGGFSTSGDVGGDGDGDDDRGVGKN